MISRLMFLMQAAAASANPLLAEKAVRDPTLSCTAYKRQRFYMFTRSDPEYARFRLSLPSRADNATGTSQEIVTSSTRGLPARSRLLRLLPLPSKAVRHPLRTARRSTRRWETCISAFSPNRPRRRWRTSWVMRAADTSRASSSTVSFPSS